MILVSDVHVRQADDRRAQLLVDLIRRIGAATEYFVLNGDIFDFCFGGSAYFRTKFHALGTALTELSMRGTRVVLVEGNHEFHLSEMGWAGVEIVSKQNFVVHLRNNERIKISHGDLIKNDPWYRAFRGLVKSRVARFVARLLPGQWLDAYALSHAKISRSADAYRILDHAAILRCFDAWLGQDEVSHGIIGHFHVPYAEPRPMAPGLMLSVESWDKPNVLVYDGAHFLRASLAEVGAPFHLTPVRSLFP